MKARKKSIWVYPDRDVWVVKKSGTTKASAIRNTKKEAFEVARNIAINQRLTIKLRDSDGSLKTVSPRQAQDNDCFLTTACVKYYGLKDDCYQLQTLRKFRDGYLSNNSENRALIQKYYLFAPKLVSLLELDINKHSLFSDIFKKINNACLFIDRGQFKQAKEIYCKAVLELQDYFKNAL